MYLETIVFGKQTNVSTNINKKLKVIDKELAIIEDKNGGHEMPNLSPFIDNEDSDESDSSEDINYTKSDFFPELRQELPHERETEEPKKRGVWTDADDHIGVKDGLDIDILPKRVDKEDSYRQYLENRFTDLYKTPKWAQIDDKHTKKTTDSTEESEDSDDDNVERTAKRFKLKSNKLEKGFLPIKKCTHLTKDHKMKVYIND